MNTQIPKKRLMFKIEGLNEKSEISYFEEQLEYLISESEKITCNVYDKGEEIIYKMFGSRCSKYYEMALMSLLRDVIELIDSFSILVANQSTAITNIILRMLFERMLYIKYLTQYSCEDEIETRSLDYIISSNIEHKRYFSSIGNNEKTLEVDRYINILKKEYSAKSNGTIHTKNREDINAKKGKGNGFLFSKINLHQLSIILDEEERYKLYYNDSSNYIHGKNIFETLTETTDAINVKRIRIPENMTKYVIDCTNLSIEIFRDIISALVDDNEFSLEFNKWTNKMSSKLITYDYNTIKFINEKNKHIYHSSEYKGKFNTKIVNDVE